jgi:hypothetical protein
MGDELHAHKKAGTGVIPETGKWLLPLSRVLDMTDDIILKGRFVFSSVDLFKPLALL